MTKILYKCRSLDNFKNFIEIFLKNRLFAAKYKELNDPMEGQYYYRHGELDSVFRQRILDEKGQLRLCSLSRVNNNELMWSHYTNGQRGEAMGVCIDNSRYDVRPIQSNGLTNLRNQDYNNQTAMEILSHKLEIWNYEEEERAFVRDRQFINVTVEEIITGRAMSNQDFGFLREIVERINPNIRIKKAETIMN